MREIDTPPHERGKENVLKMSIFFLFLFFWIEEKIIGVGSVIHKLFSFFPPSCLCRTNLASDYKTLLFNSKNARPKISNKILPREILLQMSYAEGGGGRGREEGEDRC